MDTNEIARQIGNDISVGDIIESLDLNSETILGNPTFLRQMTEYTRFRSLVQSAVNNIHETMSVEQMIQDKINTMATNIANEVAEKVMTQIANRLSLTDV